MPQVDFNAPIFTLKRQPLKEAEELVTVGALVMQLVSGVQTDGQVSASVRKSRFGLTLRIMTAAEPVEVTDAEKALITELLVKSSLAPLYAEQIDLALEGKPNPLAPPHNVASFQLKEVTNG